MTLFLITINKITSTNYPLVISRIFADDIVIYTKGKNIHSIQRHLQRTIGGLTERSKETGFTFSLNKTKVIHFRCIHHGHLTPIIKILDTPIEFVNSIKSLGITRDRKLN